MSMFEDDHFRWRETYFVLLKGRSRPALKKVEQALAALSDRYELCNGRADDDGLFESLTLISPDDFAALDICYLEGEEVLEQRDPLIKELKRPDLSARGQKLLKQVSDCDARIDVLHFEQVSADDEDDADEMLDPSALLLVLSALAKATGGVAIDPQSGTILDEEE